MSVSKYFYLLRTVSLEVICFKNDTSHLVKTNKQHISIKLVTFEQIIISYGNYSFDGSNVVMSPHISCGECH